MPLPVHQTAQLIEFQHRDEPRFGAVVDVDFHFVGPGREVDFGVAGVVCGGEGGLVGASVGEEGGWEG